MFESLPKTELHLHLDCSLSYSVAHELDPSVTPERYAREFIAPAKCVDLAEFLERAASGFMLMQSERALRAVVRDMYDQLAADNVVYAEIRFAPFLHVTQGLTAEEVVEIVDDEAAKQIERTSIDGGILLCTLRHFTHEQSLETARLVGKFRGRRVLALDIAGDEAGHPIDPHVDAFRYAIAEGLHRTAHAGEARGADSVWETLEHFRPARIGHGVRSAEDPKLLAHLAAERITLEVCPSSNVQTNAVTAWDVHPLRTLVDAGVPVAISTDARTLNKLTLTEEYERIASHFGVDEEFFRARNLAAIDAAFADEATKARVRARLS